MKNLIQRKTRAIQRSLLDWMVRHHPNLGLDKRAEFFVRLFENELKPSSRVLDIGGGWGFYSAPLERRGHHPVILDVVKPAIQHSPVVVYSGREPIPFPDDSFDASLLVTVLHHVEDPDALVREARRVTRGKLIVLEDTFHHGLGRWWTKTRDQIYNFEFFGHAGNFKKEREWIEWFEERGLKPLGVNRAYTWLSGLRILNSLFILDVNKEEYAVAACR